MSPKGETNLTPTVLPLLVLAASPPATTGPETAETGASATVVEVRAWTAPASCPTQQQLTEAVARRLEGKSSSRVAIDVKIVAVTKGFEADLTLQGPGGETARHFDGETCEVVVDAISLITAININPEANTGVVIERDTASNGPTGAEGNGDPEEATASAAQDETTTVMRKGEGPAVTPDDPVAIFDPATVIELEEEPAEAPRRRPKGAASAAFIGGWGRLPVADLAAALSLRLVWRHARAEIDGVWYPAWTIEDPDTRARARIGMWTIAARGCGGPAWSKLSLPICAGLEVGVSRGEGLGASVDRVARVPWVGFVLEPRLVWSPHPRVGAWVGASGYLAAQRAGFGFEGGQLVHQASIAGVDGRLGVEIYFP